MIRISFTLFSLLAIAIMHPASQSSQRKVQEHSINLTIVINAPIKNVWEQWVTTDGITRFFAPACLIEPQPLGRFDIYFKPDAPAGQRGAEGNYIMAMQEMQMFSFTWDAPPQWPEIRKQRTLVVIRFIEISANETQVTLCQTGWGHGSDWEAVRAYFVDAWGKTVLPFLKYSLETGPLNWSDFPKNLPQDLEPAKVILAESQE